MLNHILKYTRYSVKHRSDLFLIIKSPQLDSNAHQWKEYLAAEKVTFSNQFQIIFEKYFYLLLKQDCTKHPSQSFICTVIAHSLRVRPRLAQFKCSPDFWLCATHVNELNIFRALRSSCLSQQTATSQPSVFGRCDSELRWQALTFYTIDMEVNWAILIIICLLFWPNFYWTSC